VSATIGRTGKSIHIVLVSIVFFSIFISACPPAKASVLGIIEYNTSGTLFGENHELVLSLCYPQLTAETGYDRSLALSWDITESDEGGVFWASNQTNFNDFVYFLTNGVDDYLAPFDSMTMFSAQFDENGIFNNLPFSTKYESEYINSIQSGVDLKGYDIDNVSLTINDIYFNYNPLKLPPFNSFYGYDITYTIYGEPIPEPATLCLLALGGVLLGRKRS
jgi:hypothetical protein